MKRVKIDAIKREVTTKGRLNNYRKEGYVPAILYGENTKTLPIAVKEKDLLLVEHQYGRSVLVDLKVGTKKHPSIFKEIQRTPIGRKFLHVDFEEVNLEKPVYTKIPIVAVGESKGVKMGGILDQELHELEIEGLLTDLPDRIEVDITNLEIKDVIYARDLILPEGVKVFTEPDAVVVSVVIPKVEEVAPAAAPAEEVAEEKVEAPKAEAQKAEAPKEEKK